MRHSSFISSFRRQVSLLLAGVIIFVSASGISLAETTKKLELATPDVQNEKAIKETVKLMHAGKIKTGFEQLLPFAENGNAEAKYYVGLVYARNSLRSLIFADPEEAKKTGRKPFPFKNEENWMGLPTDEQRGLRLIKEASAGGVPMAIFSLGLMYIKGIGVPGSWNKATNLLNEAASLGVRQAFTILGELYAHKDNPKRDIPQAYMWDHVYIHCGIAFAGVLETVWEAIEIAKYSAKEGVRKEDVIKGKSLAKRWYQENKKLCSKMKGR